MTDAHDVREDEWAALVVEVLADHPEYAAVTVQAMQAGILAAVDRRGERLVDVSMGLVEALNTKPGHGKRDHDRIIKAIEASNVHPTAWSAEAIAKEQKT
jgi:hypothetical protein